MSEQKVLVEKLPESCSKCLFCYDNRPYWKSSDCIINHKELDEDEIEIKREKDCPLHSIKAHDRELVKEVCEKIREIGLQYNIEDLRGVFISYKALEEIQKEFGK